MKRNATFIPHKGKLSGSPAVNILINELELRRNELSEMLDRLGEVKVPNNKIVVYGNEPYKYYLRKDENTHGEYIRKEDMEIACNIAQSGYNASARTLVLKEIKAVEKLLKVYEEGSIADIYEAMHPGRKAIVEPVEMSAKEYIERWEEVPYSKKEFREGTPEYYTRRDERVRSKSEVIIADRLASYGIPYRYEAKLILGNGKEIHPDFTVLNIRTCKEYYWEHLGMMDDMEYVRNACRRLDDYEDSNIFTGDKLIVTHESYKRPLNSRVVNIIIEKYLL